MTYITVCVIFIVACSEIYICSVSVISTYVLTIGIMTSNIDSRPLRQHCNQNLSYVILSDFTFCYLLL